MLTNSHITTILPVVQMDRARRFYEEKTVNHVFSTGDEKCAWLTDTEGNILCLHQDTRRQ